MGKQDELIKIDRIVKDTEVRLRTFKTNIDVIQKEFDFLLTIEKQLEENISCLKNVKIIALAIEYKKAREDLKKIKTRLGQLKSDLIDNERAHREVEIYLKKNKEAYDKLSTQNDNVLQGKFGKRRV